MKRAAPVIVLLVLVLAGAIWFATRSDEPNTGSGSAEVPTAVQPSPTGSSPATSRSAAGRVSGRVERDGKPAAKAVVTLRTATQALPSFALDDGRFLFDDVPAGELFLSAVTAEAASDVVGPLVLLPGARLEDVVLTLAPAASLEGVVVDTRSRAPVAGAAVTSPSGNVRTGADGRFILRAASGQVWVEVRAAGYLPRTEWIAVEPGRAKGRIELVLTPEARIAGTVLESGQPVAGASVWTEAVVGPRRGERSAMVLTDKEGKFELGCPDGIVSPQAATPRGARVRGKELRLGLGERREGVVLEASDVSPVEGRVTRDGQPLPGASVSVIEAGAQEVMATAATGPTGQFQVPALQRGRYVVQVGLGGYRALAGPFEHPGDGAPWLVAVKGGAVLEGEVQPAGPGVEVRWRSGDWAGPSANTVTDAAGHFRFEGVPAGLLSLDAEGPGGAATARAKAGDHVVLTLAKGSVVVDVRDGSGGPVSDATLLARSLTTGVVRQQVTLAPDGRFHLDLPPGAWDLVAEAPGRGRSVPARVDVGQGAQQLTLTLAPTISLRGFIRDASNKLPLAGVQVMSADWTDVNQYRVAVQTDARGEYVLPAVSRTSAVLARREGYFPLGRPASEADPSGRLDLELAPDPTKAHAPSEPPAFEGVGMVLAPQNNRVVVTAVNEGSPAERAGVLRGDVIIAVDGVPAQLPVESVVGRIRGPAGTPVTITFERSGGALELVLRRRVLHF